MVNIAVSYIFHVALRREPRKSIVKTLNDQSLNMNEYESVCMMQNRYKEDKKREELVSVELKLVSQSVLS